MLKVLVSVVSVLGVTAAASATGVTVYSNSGGTGDLFTNAGGTNTGQAVGASGWYYNNVRNNGNVGINTTYARSGNGSVYMETTQGPGGASSKADIEFFASAAPNSNGNYGATSALGALSDLTAFSYEWYRDSVSTNDALQHPALRLQVYSPVTLEVGYLIFERAYNGGGAVPTNTWTFEDIMGSNSFLWGSSTLFNNYTTSLAQWMADSRNFLVIGVSAGVGSGWGAFRGAVDNITIGFGETSYTFNFEVVPAPSAAALAGLAGLAATRRRRR